MRKRRMRRFLLSIFGSDHDESEVLEGKEEMEKKMEKIMELLSTEEKDDKSADASELVSLVENFFESYQTLHGRYDHLVEKLNKSIKDKNKMNGDISDSDSSSESDSSDSEASKDEHGLSNKRKPKKGWMPVEDYENQQQELELWKNKSKDLENEVAAMLAKLREGEKLASELSQKEASFSALSSELQSMMESTKALEAENESLKLELTASNQNLVHANQRLRSIYEENEAHILEKSTITNNLQDAQKSIEALQNKSDMLKHEIEKLHNEDSGLKKETEMKAKQIADLNIHLETTKEEKLVLGSENATLLSKFWEAEETIERLNNEAGTSLELANKRSLEIADLLMKIKILNQELGVKNDEILVLSLKQSEMIDKIKEADKTNEALSIPLERLNKENSKLLIDLEGLKLEMKAADGKISEMEKVLELMREEKHVLNMEKELLISEKSSLLMKLNEMEESITELKTETDTFKDKTTVLQNENTVLKQELETVGKQLSDLRMQLTNTVEEKEAIFLESAAVLSKIRQAEREIEVLRNEASINLQSENEKISENEKLLNEIENLKTSLEEAHQHRAHLIQELSAAEQRTCDLESKMLKISTQKSETERTITELRADHEVLKDERLKLSAVNAELAEEVREKDTENMELLDKTKQVENLIDDLKAEIEHVKSSNSNLKKTLEAEGIEVLRLQNELAEAQNQASVEIGAVTTRANSLQAELDLLQGQRVDLEEQIRTLTGHLSEEKALMECVESELKTKISDQVATLNEQITSFNELAANHKLVEERLQETSRKLMIAQERIQELEAKEEIIRRLEVVEQEQKMEIGKLKENLEETVAKLAHSMDEKVNVEKEMKGQHRVVESLEVQMRLLNQKLKITETEYKARCDSDKRRMDDLIKESGSLQEQIMSFTSRTHLLESELTLMRSLLEVELARFGNDLHNLETAFNKNCNHLQTQLVKSAQEIRAVKEMSEALVSKNQELEDVKQGLTERLEHTKGIISKLEEEVGRLRTKLAAVIDEEEEFKEMAARSEKRVMELERRVQEEEEEGRLKDEEKREAIRQLCYQIEYHRENCDRLIEVLTRKAGGNRG